MTQAGVYFAAKDIAMLVATVLFAVGLSPLIQQSAEPTHPVRLGPPVYRVQHLPEGAVRLNARITPQLSPYASARINSLATSFNNTLAREPKNWPPAIIIETYRDAHTAFPQATPSDLDAIVFAVMMQANADQEAGLQQQIDAMQALNAKKAAIRAQSAPLYGTATTPAKESLDSMNEMSEMTSMRLQMAMDRRSKFVEALGNIMKKIDSTQETIIQNMK